MCVCVCVCLCGVWNVITPAIVPKKDDPLGSLLQAVSFSAKFDRLHLHSYCGLSC